ncbi:MAG: hypothetical protein M1820_001572 [Bogoriella megaspora]|nr:MAG: hypothetical protein M1820_001572 [Bogoriella megaspora]
MSESHKDKGDFILRGVKKPSPLGTTLLVGLRALDPFLQYAILGRRIAAHLIHRSGGSIAQPNASLITNTILDRLELSPHAFILLSMSVGSSLKQIIWATFTSQETIPVSSAIAISVYNTLLNSINTLLFVCEQTSLQDNHTYSGRSGLFLGIGLYTVGIIAELTAEIQRKVFKQSPANNGKVYEGGMFTLARHINYGGYILWRSGFALASAGWIFGLLSWAFFFYDFAMRGVPVLDKYCQGRVSHVKSLKEVLPTDVTAQYGQQWIEFKKKVPYALIPIVY